MQGDGTMAGRGRWAALAAAVLCAVLAVGAAPAAPARGQTATPQLPAGFVRDPYPTGLDTGRITDFVFLPSGGYLTTGKTGAVGFVSADRSVQRTIARLSVYAVRDSGLVGIALANDYATSGRVYLVYTRGEGDDLSARLAAFTVDDPSAPERLTDERAVIEDIPIDGPIHNTGALAVGPDDSIYLGVGDGSGNTGANPQRLRAQDLRTPYGKILRVRSDGRGVASNPFYDPAAPSSWQSRVWAYGLRMPFRMTFRPGSGTPFIGDVGWYTAEEINVGRPGANYGWPCWEGGARTPQHRDTAECADIYASVDPVEPLWWYPRSLPPGGGTSITAGVVYTGTSYPPAYRNALFVGDFARGTLWTAQLDGENRLVRPPEAGSPGSTDGVFGRDIGGPVAFRTGPEGDVYYADLSANVIHRLRYAPGNRVPVAVASVDLDVATQTATFSGAESYDLDGDALSYRWDFGDGASATEPDPVHTYETPGSYTATLTVSDPSGETATSTVSVATDNHPPSPGLVTPPEGTTFAVGDTVTLRAEPTDAEDGALPDSAVSWEVLLHHCPPGGGCHLHPSLVADGATLSTPFSDHGGDTSMEIAVSVTDSRGAVTRRSYTASPRLRTLTVSSEPPGVPLSVDDATVQTASIVAGGASAIAAPARYGDLEFAGWSDDGGRAHTVTMPDADLSLVAHYRPVSDIDHRYAQLGGPSSLLGAPTGPEVAVPGGRMRPYARGRIYWSADHGAHFVYGAILHRYVRFGASATLGVPTSDEFSVRGGRASSFTRGDIYWSSRHGAQIVKGGMLAHYRRLGGPVGRVGLPVGESAATTAGRVQRFTGGNMYWSPDARVGTSFVYGGILYRYGQLGGPASFLGLPRSDEYSVPGGRASDFVGGRIYWTSRFGPQALRGPILSRYHGLGHTGSFLGPPRREVHAVKGGHAADFERGRIYSSPSTGTHYVWGDILGLYLHHQGPRSRLGLPVSDEYSVPGGRRSDFQHGSIFWDAGSRRTWYVLH